jgi:hypothetical protein
VAILSAQDVYPIFVDDDSSVEFLDFIHDGATTIIQAAGGIWAPQVYVSLMYGARHDMMRTGSTMGVFCPDSQAITHGKAKHFFPGFTIRFRTHHSFVNSAGASEALSLGDYHYKFHRHDGHGRLTIDASSFPLPTAKGILTSRPIYPINPSRSS